MPPLHRTAPIIALALVAASGSATAVEYTFPGSAYQQLQRTDTYETVCQTGSPCDVPAGTYTLLTFAGGPARRETVTVGGGSGGGGGSSSGSAVRIERVAESCRWGDFRDAPLIGDGLSGRDIRDFSCTASCPAGATLVGVTACALSTDDEGDFETQAADFVRVGEGARCQRRYPGYPTSAIQVEMEVEVACLLP